MEKLFSQIEKYILFAIVLLLPLLVIPISPNPFVVPKLALLVLRSSDTSFYQSG